MAKFFRIFIDEYEERMRIPHNLAQLLRDETGTTVETVSIWSTLGKIWHVGLIRDGTNLYFTKGWPEFVGGHQIQIGYFMVFSYEVKSIFHVEIFDNTTCLKEYHCSSVVSPDGSNSSDSVTGYKAGKTEYTKAGNNSENSYTSSEVPNKRSKHFQDGKERKVYKGVNLRGKSLNNRCGPEKNLDSSAVPYTRRIFKTFRESYNFNYMPLGKKFCEKSMYKLTNGIAMVKSENSEAYPVKFKAYEKSSHLGRGWRQFCLANGVRLGDRCQISIIGDNEFFVTFKHQ